MPTTETEKVKAVEAEPAEAEAAEAGELSTVERRIELARGNVGAVAAGLGLSCTGR
jgi:hypothetical protein